MINIIVATANDNVIGRNNELPWHSKEDLKYFKEKTSGHPIIMGRKTFESLPSLLSNRHHVVISRQANDNEDNVSWVNSMQEALLLATSLDEEVFFIGGGSVYKQALGYTDRIYITRINLDVDGDTYFPDSLEGFQLTSSVESERSGLVFEIYDKI